MKMHLFREPRRDLSACLALFGGRVILLLSSPYLGWQWATGMSGILLGLGCVSLGEAKLLPRNNTSAVAAGYLRIAGFLLFVLMVIYVVSTVLS